MTNCGSQAAAGRERGQHWTSDYSNKEQGTRTKLPKRMPSRRIRKWRTGNRKYF